MNGKNIKLENLAGEFTVCKTAESVTDGIGGKFLFVGKTDNETSVVCLTEYAPEKTIAREDTAGKAFAFAERSSFRFWE